MTLYCTKCEAKTPNECVCGEGITIAAGVDWKDTVAAFREVPQQHKQKHKQKQKSHTHQPDSGEFLPGVSRGKQIKFMTNKLRQVWREHPHMSLTEVMSAAFTDLEMVDIFPTLTDKELFERLKTLYGIDLS